MSPIVSLADDPIIECIETDLPSPECHFLYIGDNYLDSILAPSSGAGVCTH